MARGQAPVPRPQEEYTYLLLHYDKHTGLNTDFNSLLPKLTSTKAQITIAERKEQEYLQDQRQHNLFFDEQTDEKLIKFRKKLSSVRWIIHNTLIFGFL